MARPSTRRFSAIVLCVLLSLTAGRGGAQEPPDRRSPGTDGGRYPVSIEDEPRETERQQVFLHGRILDPLGAPVPSAAARIVSPSSSLSTISDALGEFTLTVNRDVYSIEILADGFRKSSRSLDLRQDDISTIEFTLQVEGRGETVVVTANRDYRSTVTISATRTPTPLLELPQSVTVVSQDLVRDQLISSIAEVVRYVPGITAHQGENNRDQVVIRGNSSSADFFLNGVRDDVQYYRDLYNTERVEALMGPNAMTFGRGGGGGVINRVTKEAGFTPLREIAVQAGSHGNRRITADLDQPFGARLAARLNLMYENSGSFRDRVHMERQGISPTVTFAVGSHTRLAVAYEYFRDRRVADRGIPSFRGRPADVDIATFFGNPDESRVRARLNLGAVTVEHQEGRFGVRTRTLLGDYDRGYQNFVPGPVTPDKARVAISAYNNATRRRNSFNQTDATYAASTGPVRHLFLAGAEFGLQSTDNLRHTGYFNNSAAIVAAPYESPTINTPVTFRQSPTDADNHVGARLAAVYIQDQAALSKQLKLIGGIRVDYFDLRHHNHRTGEDLGRVDRLVSPRVGIVYTPVASLSMYASSSVSHLPSSGDQFSSLTSVTQQLKPERFRNLELGLKWDLLRRLSLSAAVYRLDRTNTRATDPADPSRIAQTGSQRTEGFEAGWSGRVTHSWDIAGGYARQDAVVTSATAVARAGARVAQVPRNSWSLWNNYRFHPRVGAGLGLSHRSDMYAAVDNSVILPGYTRADAAIYLHLRERMRLQVNLENVINRKYFLNADGNNNISPGSPRAVRVALVTSF